MDDDPNPISIETLIKAIQALPDMDEDLVLDAIDFLEDENKARTFMTLDVKFRRKWLIRKLRLQMKIVVNMMMSDDKVALDVLTTDTIADVKAEMQAKLGILVKQYWLTFRGRFIEDNITLGDFGFEEPWRIQEFTMGPHFFPDPDTKI